ncbi:MAG: hypothetical protein ACRCZK_01760 [Oscillospiraceae bacterium]
MERTTLIISQLLTLSVLVYATIDVIGQVADKAISKKYTYFIKKGGAIILGIYLCLYFKTDITFLVRTQYDAIGAVMAGVIISQGTGYVKDIFNQLNQGAKDSETIAEELNSSLKELSIEEISEITTEALEEKGVLFTEELENGRGY